MELDWKSTMPKPALVPVPTPPAPGATPPRPPRQLGLHGGVLWHDILAEYDIRDRAGLELLTLACEATDRAERLARQVDQDGEVIRASSGPKAHPALRDELANRAFVARTLERLGLNLEAVKPMGRPPRAF
jgi:hypothetical protein